LNKALKFKACKQCGAEFSPFNSMQKCCDVKCAIEYSARQRVNKEIKADKDRIKTKAQWIKEAQAKFNEFIRLRDYDKPCISCGRHHKGQYHAGHYISVGAAPELRFDEDNCHKQCSACNNYLSGNLVKYRVNLIQKIGLERVEALEGPHEAKKYTIEKIKEIKKHYSDKVKELKKTINERA